MFLFSDTQIVDEVFLEDINNILNCGDVPNVSMNRYFLLLFFIILNKIRYGQVMSVRIF